MQEFTPEQIAELSRLDDEVQRITRDLHMAGVPISGPNGNPVLMDMIFDDDGAPLAGRRFEFETRVLHTWIVEANAAAPELKAAAARMKIQQAAQLRQEMIIPPGAPKPFGIVHEGRVTKLRE